MALPHTFANLSSAQMSYLDDNFNALGKDVVIIGGFTGTNTQIFTSFANQPVTAATSYITVGGIAGGTNTGAVSANVDGLGLYPVYKDTPLGPQPLTGGEIVLDNYITLTYDPALNSSTGGFHLGGAISRTASQILDSISNTQGSILYRGASAWSALGPGTSGQFLQTLGAAANPQWANGSQINENWTFVPFTAGGTFTTPAGTLTSTVFEFGVLPGGAGGGSTSGGTAGGGGGGSGSLLVCSIKGFTAGGGQTLTFTIGTAGAGSISSASAGTSGGLSKLTISATDIMTANGPTGGASGVGGSNVVFTGGTTGSTSQNVAGAGLTLVNTYVISGGKGGDGYWISTNQGIGGAGASGPYGQGGPQMSASGTNVLTGYAATGYGAGGTGGASGSTGAQNTGGAGSGGFGFVRYVL